MQFCPGQWIDLHIPGLPQAGGFTITSTPDQAKGTRKNGYLELAVQKSPRNPAAAWLWQQSNVVLGSELMVRVGGNFVWPPPNVKVQDIKKVVFVSGGVGINPLMSMLSYLRNQPPHFPISVQFLYASKVPRDGYTYLLFFSRLLSAFNSPPSPDWNLHFYLTRPPTLSPPSAHDPSNSAFCAGEDYKILGANQVVHQRRVTHKDLIQALGPVWERHGVVAYVCGPSGMTDEFIKVIGSQEGMEERRVLCEKWW